MTFEECKKEVARKHGLGKTLVTGHLSAYWAEAAELYLSSAGLTPAQAHDMYNADPDEPTDESGECLRHGAYSVPEFVAWLERNNCSIIIKNKKQ